VPWGPFVITWLRWLPQGWPTLPIAIGLLVLVVAYIGFGPPAVLKLRTGLRVPEAHPGGYSREDLVGFGRLAGRGPYRAQLWWDMVFALLYGAGLIAVVNGTLGWALHPAGRLFLLGLVPFAVIATDLAEDILLLVATLPKDPDRWGTPEGLVKAARVITVAKFSLTGVSVILVLAGAVALGVLGPGRWNAAHFTELALALLSMLLFHFGLTMAVPPKAKFRKEEGGTFEVEEDILLVGPGAVIEAESREMVTVPPREVLVQPESTSLGWEALSAFVKLGAAALALFFGSRWFLHLFTATPVSLAEAARALGVDFTGGWPWRLAIWGGSFGGGIVLALYIAYRFVPLARERGPDPRFKDMTPAAVATKIALILVGTVALEEVLFRGVLFAAWSIGYHPIAYAVVGSSVVFGLWHVGPALRDEERRRQCSLPAPGGQMNEGERSRAIEDRRTTSVMSTVIAMVAAGVGFCLLRIWSGGIWAPAMVHFTANSGGVLFSWLSARRGL